MAEPADVSSDQLVSTSACWPGLVGGGLVTWPSQLMCLLTSWCPPQCLLDRSSRWGPREVSEPAHVSSDQLVSTSACWTCLVGGGLVT